ncbi:hypothetical protein D3C72_1196480 [compost metagenome]
MARGSRSRQRRHRSLRGSGRSTMPPGRGRAPRRTSAAARRAGGCPWRPGCRRGGHGPPSHRAWPPPQRESGPGRDRAGEAAHVTGTPQRSMPGGRGGYVGWPSRPAIHGRNRVWRCARALPGPPFGNRSGSVGRFARDRSLAVAPPARRFRPGTRRLCQRGGVGGRAGRELRCSKGRGPMRPAARPDRICKKYTVAGGCKVRNTAFAKSDGAEGYR